MKSVLFFKYSGSRRTLPAVLSAVTAALLCGAGAYAQSADDVANAPLFPRDSGFVATNGIAAQVNDKIITLDQLRQQITPIVPEIRRRSANREQFEQNIAHVTREVLQNLVDQILIVKEFDDKGYVLPEVYIRNEMDDYITKNFNGDRSLFLESLKHEGTNEMAFRNRLRDGIVVSYMRAQMISSATQVSPEEINNYYQRHRSQFYEDAGVKLSMIILQPSGTDGAQRVQQQTEAIEKALQEGQDFADLAKKYSQGPNAADGGDWGWRNYDDLRRELSEVAKGLQAGEHSKPVTLDGVTYIIYIADKRESGVKELDTVRAEIERAITGQLARQSQQRWLERLRKQAYVRYYLHDVGPSPVTESAPVTMRLGTQAKEDVTAETPTDLLPQNAPQAPANVPTSLPRRPTEPIPPSRADQMPQVNPSTGRLEAPLTNRGSN